MKREYRDLGMDREITRRDFINGVMIGVTGAYAALRGGTLNGQQPAPAPDYPA